MATLPELITRNSSASPSLTPTMIKLLIALLSTLLFGLLLMVTLYIFRHIRLSKHRKQSALPLYSEQPSHRSHHRRLTITASPYGHRDPSIHIHNEKHSLVDYASGPPGGPVPEIRITFPDEEDEAGKRTSGGVVVVRIGEMEAVGFEPVVEERLPPYETSDAERYQSLDLDRMGGLKEKEQGRRWL
ncbi:MAG: hypothetical protein LQ347_001454 [Umbilicaria vellea]|nr:MAG: hypothetical protein LQ347_001454 [Umbilicaria vellea]